MDRNIPARLTLQYILSGDSVLRATTFGGRSLAESTIKVFEEFEIDREYLRSKVDEVLGFLRAAGSTAPSRDADPGETERIAELGQDLFRELVPSSFRAKLYDAAEGDLLLAIDSSLAWIPWELLHDGSDFLCLRFNMGRIVSVATSAGRVDKRTLAAPVDHLVITDPEGDLPAAAAEGVATRDLLLPLGNKARPTLLSGRVSQAGFIDGLKRADVFHFAGHIDGGPEAPAVRLSGGTCSVAQIKKFSGRFSFPPLVFLNGCRSSIANRPLRIEDGQLRALDLASAFLVCGVRHFIGTLWDVRDTYACTAGTAFFQALYDGLCVGGALREARERMMRDFGRLSMAWAGYVLYGDPSFKIDGLQVGDESVTDGLAAVEERRTFLLKNLASPQPREQFFAAVGLLQIGDRSGFEILKREIGILYGLLENEDPEERRRGATVLRILTGKDMGYGAEAEPAERSAAVAAFKEWWESGAAENHS